MPNINFEIVCENGAWPDENALALTVSKVCAALSNLATGLITFVFTDDAAIQVLNRDWRGYDKPTNVLSFPDGDMGDGDIIHLGDVIVAYETLEREARTLTIPFEHHFIHLLLHGSLHLLGYDHIEDTDAEVMESLEIKILEQMGIKNPYQNDNLSLD